MRKWLTEVIRIGNSNIVQFGSVLRDVGTLKALRKHRAPGFYLVLWPAHSPGNQARLPRLFGPYQSAHSAEQMRCSARFLGLT